MNQRVAYNISTREGGGDDVQVQFITGLRALQAQFQFRVSGTVTHRRDLGTPLYKLRNSPKLIQSLRLLQVGQEMPGFKKRRLHGALMQEREYNAQIYLKSELCGFKRANAHNKCVHSSMYLANLSQQMCPWLYVPGKFVTKPMSYVATLHLVPNQIRPKINTVPMPGVAWTRP